MNKIKIGIIGAGGISNEHIKGYINSGKAEIYAICDINIDRAKEKSEKYKIKKVYDDYRDMLKLEEIDAVSICTWNNVHAPASIAALRMGKHVLCEKPMAMNGKQAIEMEQAAAEVGKLLMIGFVRRHGNDCGILKDFIDAGDLGEIYYTKATYIRRNGNPGGWFGDKSRSGGGPLIDLGVHVVDLARYLSGNPKAVSVAGATYSKLGNRNNIKVPKGYISADIENSETNDVEDIALAFIRFDNGMVMNVEASYSLNSEESSSIELYGTKAGAKLNPALKIYTEKNDYLVDMTPAHNTELSFDGLFEKEVNHFIECITEDRKCIAPAKDGVEIMKILDAIYESARTGKEILISS